MNGTLHSRLSIIRMMVGSIAIIVGLSGCGALCPTPDELEAAARYAQRADNSYDLPLDTWTKNTNLEYFIRKTVESRGVTTLTAKYGMQCSPRASVIGCADCFVCSRSVHQGGNYFRFPVSYCLDYGEMLIHAEVGPGSKVSAMTYWKSTPEVTKRR